MGESIINILIFTGAGISADSGIPTFRDSNGLWENHKVEDVASPQGFERDPNLVWNFYKQRFNNVQNCEPNASHYAVTKLQKWCEDNGHACHIITQNIDNLHERSGSQNVMHIHGTITAFNCNNKWSCGFKTSENLYEQYAEDLIPECPKCGQYMRPSVVWFGEQLAINFDTITTLAEQCDVCIIIGTSAQVQPAASIPVHASYNNAKIFEFNLDQAFHLMDNRKYSFQAGKACETLPRFVEEFINKEKYK